MTESTINPSIKSKRGRPPVDSEQIGIRLTRDLLDAIEAYQSDEPEAVPKTEAVRRIVRDWLISHGYLSDPAAKGGEDL